MHWGRLGAFLAGLAASGCAQLEPMCIASRASNVPVVAVLKDQPADAVELGQVSATTCLNRIWDSRPGWDAALDSLKQKAASKGANALTGVSYEEASVVYCASALQVSGTALKIP
jgi:Putative heavy-metal-binding